MNIAEQCRAVYQNLADMQSKMIYINRLNYSLTGDHSFIENIVNQTLRQNPLWKELCGALKRNARRNPSAIFGAGIWGNILYHETKREIPWKVVVDSNPQGKRIGELTTVGFEQFVETYTGETVVLSSYKNGKEMYLQLIKAGISDDRIIDAGSVIYELTEKAIYFDLEPCRTQGEKEIFIDAGGFDGLTTLRFMEWCEGNGYSYIFEPDKKNRVLIDNNLKQNSDYETVPKALWSRTASLAIDAKGNFASTVSELDEGQDQNPKEYIESISLDEFADDRKITYIKMDIEGAENEALKGAERVIRGQRLKLAVSVYHRAEDIWEIPSLILRYCPDYQFYLRHYSFSDYDTVLYAIPS